MPAPIDPQRVSEADQTRSLSAPGDTSALSFGEDTPRAPSFAAPAAPGEVGTLGPYRVVKLLGRGGMGAVYAALDTRLDRRVALKVMLPKFAANQAARSRFLREAKAAAKVAHDNVVTVFEADERDGVPYIAMQFLEGYPLDEYLKKKGTPTLLQTLRIAREAAAGLAAAHTKGLIHRDVKPGNLWLEAPHGRVKVLDFGLARPVNADAEVTHSGAMVGTPAYMSPEQARGDHVDHRTDLFSLGALLYQLTTGRLPFEGPNTMAVLLALATADPPPVRGLNPAVPEPLAELIHQLLAKNPESRPRSADEVAERVQAVGEGHASPATASQPQVVYVPIQVTAVPEANPFADLDAPETLPAPRESTAAPKPERKKPGGARWLWPAVGLAALLAVAAVAVVIVIQKRGGTEAVKDDPKPPAPTSVPKPPPVIDASPDRKAAAWALELGGSVRINGQDRDIKAAAELPNERFTLTWVSLRDTQATDAGLAHLKECKGLLVLSLDRTQVTDAGLAHVAGCKDLQSLTLGRTQVTDAGMAHIKDFRGLTNLNLDTTAVTDVGLAHCQNFQSLRHLNLNSTKVTGSGLAHLKDCKELGGLQLNSVPLSDAGLAHLAGLKKLQTLNIGGTLVTNAGLAHLEGCEGLQHLSLNGTKATDAGLAHLKELKGLTALDVRLAAMTDDGLAHLKELKGLTYLNVKETKVTAKGLAEFHAAVPKCKVEHDGGVIEPIDPDRKAAEWVLKVGGKVVVYTEPGQTVELTGADAKWPETFTKFHTIDLLGATGVDDAVLENLRGVSGIHYILSFHNLPITDAGLERLASMPGLLEVQTVKLLGTKVTDAGMVHLNRFTKCNTLPLHYTGVTEAGLRQLRDHPALRSIAVKGSRITSAALKELRQFKNLTAMSVQAAAITDADLAGEWNPQLQRLSLDECDKITDAGLEHLAGSKLTLLTVTKTKVTEAGVKKLAAALPACRIDWDGGTIEPKPGGADRQVAEWVLSLGGTVRVNGTMRVIAAAADLPKEPFTLSMAKLDSTTITDADLARLAPLKGLTDLRVADTGVTNAGLGHIKELRGLTFLRLGGLNVTDDGLAHLKDLKELQHLELYGTKVTDAGLAHLQELKGLTHLTVKGTKVTAKGLADFHAAVPGCKIEHDGGTIEPKK